MGMGDIRATVEADASKRRVLACKGALSVVMALLLYFALLPTNAFALEEAEGAASNDVSAGVSTVEAESEEVQQPEVRQPEATLSEAQQPEVQQPEIQRSEGPQLQGQQSKAEGLEAQEIDSLQSEEPEADAKASGSAAGETETQASDKKAQADKETAKGVGKEQANEAAANASRLKQDGAVAPYSFDYTNIDGDLTSGKTFALKSGGSGYKNGDYRLDMRTAGSAAFTISVANVQAVNLTVYDENYNQVASYDSYSTPNSTFTKRFFLNKGSYLVDLFVLTSSSSSRASISASQRAQQSLSNGSLQLSASSYAYDGTAKKPSATVKVAGRTLKAGTDYAVSYKNNVKAGTATVTVAGKKEAGYVGSLSKAFRINRSSLAKAAVTLAASSYVYDGNEKRPSVTVKLGGKTLKNGTDYTVSYRNNVNAGTATVTVRGKGSLTGSVAKRFTIKKKPSVQYYVHRQTYGWEGKYSKKDGQSSGTTGQKKRLEGIYIRVANKPYSGSIQYRTHVQKIGWQGWRNEGQMSGTTGKKYRLEAIQIKLTGQMAQKYDVYYRVHAQKFGWMGWAKNGASAGTQGYAYRLESIQIKLVPKGGAAPGSTSGAFSKKHIPTNADKRAVEMAKRYSWANMSRERLISQLEFEGYTHSQAVYGTDHCGQNWYANAAKKAKSYMSWAGYTKSRLIEQLESPYGENYTHDQAVYGANQCGVRW